jgi:hypothetical protein
MTSWYIILALQSLFTFVLTGLIWSVQKIHYPLFHWVEKDKFCDFIRDYQTKISFLLSPLMVLECFFGVLLLTVARAGEDRLIAFILFGLLLVIWFSTFCLQIPEHVSLSREFHYKSIRKLIASNWIRTISWTLRSLLLGWLIFHTHLH